MDVHKTLYPFYTRKKMPHVTVTLTKKPSLAAIARYISISTIYTVGYLQVFNETTNYDFVLLSKQGRTQLIYSTELTTEHVFENFKGELPGWSPLIAGSACQHHLQTRAANLWDLSSAINKTLLAFGSFSQWTLIMHKPNNWVDLYVDTTTDNLL